MFTAKHGLSVKSLASVLALSLTVPVAAGTAQQNAPKPNSAAVLNLPQNSTPLGTLPQVVKATVIVNGEVITQTDINHRMALLAIANGQDIPAEEQERLRQQVLRNLIDETLQIHAARTDEINVTKADIDRTLTRVAGNLKQSPAQLSDYLAARGSSISTLRRQIEAETAWRRLQSKRIESTINVGDDEVKSVIAKLEAAKGSDEYRVGEIYLSATSANRADITANADKIFDALRQGGSFVAYARQYSEATTAAVGGDLGWVRPEQLPDSLAAAVRQMRPGQISRPIPVPGGLSIVAVQDQRKVLTADPRDAVLSLKQITLRLPAGSTRASAEPMLRRFTDALQGVRGCGNVEAMAQPLGGDVVQSDGVKMRDLPPALQDIMIPLQVGQATPPFGSIDDGVRALVLCGRDEADSNVPSFEQMSQQLIEERVNLRARRYLRDLRRDAVIDFRG